MAATAAGQRRDTINPRAAYILAINNCKWMVYMTAAETHLDPEHSHAEPNTPLPPLPPSTATHQAFHTAPAAFT